MYVNKLCGIITQTYRHMSAYMFPIVFLMKGKKNGRNVAGENLLVEHRLQLPFFFRYVLILKRNL